LHCPAQPDDMIWDDSALIDAYNEAVEQYKVQLYERFARRIPCGERTSPQVSHAPGASIQREKKPRQALRQRHPPTAHA
jgi:hypothetical protein